MKIKSRSGILKPLSLDKIKVRITDLVSKFNLNLDMDYIDKLTIKIVNSIYDGISSSELDEETARISSNDIIFPDALKLAGIISIDNHHQRTKNTFSEKIELLYKAQVINDNFYQTVKQHSDLIDLTIDYSRDFSLDYFGFMTLYKTGYLLKIGNKVIERPSDMFMREALALHPHDINKALENYNYLSNLYFTHATPTLFSAGTKYEQFASCFLTGSEDSVEGLYKTLSDCAQISKHAGGIGIHLSMVRASGSEVGSGGGQAGGLVPYLKVLNETARHINQAGKRPGSFAVYIEPYHADIFDFLQMKVNDGGKDEFKARDLFYALWISDLFMKRVKEDGDWYLMCPHQSPGLNDVYGEEFENLYNQYVSEGKFREKIKAQSLWRKILDTQIGSGTPYLLYKDACNKKSNQKNLGTIKSSNLCVAPETLILTSTGYHPIRSLSEKLVKVWNGEEWSSTVIRKTGINQKLVRVKLSNSTFIDCTPEHKFHIQIGQDEMIIDAQNLEKGMPLVNSYDFPVIREGIDEGVDENELSITPVNASLRTKINWLKNMLYLRSTGNEEGVLLASLRIRLLQNLRYLLQTLGVSATLYQKFGEYYLLIKYSAISKLNQLGLGYFIPLIHQSYSPYDEGNWRENSREKIYIEEVVNLGRIDDTYCFTEEKRHTGIFNGVLTGQCSEIVQYSDPQEISTCNLASVALPRFVQKDKDNKLFYNHSQLREIVHLMVENLNSVIDRCYYPLPETKNSNLKHRPMGIGVQGLAHTYMKMAIPFESEEARKLNREIFETIYYASLEKSNQMAEKYGAYSSFKGSPLSLGKFQFDLWKEVHPDLYLESKLSGRWDWNALREKIIAHGVYNSLLTTCMPTASTSQILGNSESIDPLTSNMYSRKVSSGEYIVLNNYLVNDLFSHNLWHTGTKDLLQYFSGSVQNIPNMPKEIKEIYKTVWEIPQKELINQSADRALFIDQSQSLNLFLEDPTPSKLSAMNFYAWSVGLKTGLYYLRQKSRTSSTQITVDTQKVEKLLCKFTPGQAPADCQACSS